MLSDHSIREQVLDITQSFIVQAPAGSGKTSLLVQRFLALLAVVEQAPEEIIALTFTRKAAAEMRARIINSLQLGAQANSPDDPYQHKLWTLAKLVLVRDQQHGWELLANPARLKIQTIDSLCASITAQMPIMTQFGAQPEKADNPEWLYQKSVAQLLQETTASDPWHAALFNLLAHLGNDRDKIAELLVSMLAVREQWLPIVINDLSQQAIRANLEEGLKFAVDEALDNLQVLIPEWLDYQLLAIEEPRDLTAWQQLANLLLTKDHTWRRTVTAQQGFAAPSQAKNKEEKEVLKARKDAMLRMLENLQAHEEFRRHLSAVRWLPPTSYNESQWQVVNSLAIVLRVLVAKLTLVFKDYGQVDFSAVTLAALHALGAVERPSDLALTLDYKIRHILVDEFQDTSIAQFSLLEKLTANWEPYDDKTLFLVGDPMQSIYRFRKAEVSLFLKAKDEGIGKISLNFVQLRTNFRSTLPVVTWVNRVFAACFPTTDDISYGAITYMSAAAAPGRNSEIATSVAVQCKNLTLESEPGYIVALLHDLQRSQPGKSIAILVRAKNQLRALLPALREANIAYHGVELENLSQHPVIQDLLALTKALLHLDDRIAWLAILRAPWCGLSLADLLLIAQQPSTIWYNLNQAEILQQLSQDGQVRAMRLRTVLQTSFGTEHGQAIDLKVQHAWLALGANTYNTDPNLQQAIELYFVSLANLALRREILDPDFLEQQLAYLFSQPAVVDPNAVQIMTMHKAKGLEFDIVILPSLAKTTRGDEHKLLIFEHRYYPQPYLLIAPIKSVHEEADPIYDYLAWNEDQRQTWEELRLLYVAATRAREQIYCLAELKNDGGKDGPLANSLLAKIWPALQQEFVAPELAMTKNLDADSSLGAASRPLTRLPTAWYQANPYTAPDIKMYQASLITWQKDWLRMVGIVLHRIFWRIVTSGAHPTQIQNQTQEQVHIWRQQLRQLGMANADLDVAVQLLSTALNNTLQDPIGAKILDNGYAESYAEWRLTTKNECRSVIPGSAVALTRDPGITNYTFEYETIVLDRAFLDQDGKFWLVDYKLIQQASEIPTAIERYSAQLSKYVTALRMLKPEIKITAGLYFPLQAKWQSLV